MASMIGTAAHAPPDWATLAADLACPLCNYNLRGLTNSRCPECGFAFAWAELLDAGRDRHPWLFEHAGRRPPRRWRTARAFLATYARAALPRRFWRAVTPANPVHVGRLILYWVIASAPLLGVFAIAPARLAVDRAQFDAAKRAAFTPAVGRPGYFNVPSSLAASIAYTPRLYSLFSPSGRQIPVVSANQLDALIPRPFSFAFVSQVRDEYADSDMVNGSQAVAVVLAWPWLSFAALLLFQASMRRAKVNAGHALRVALYGCDFGLLAVGAAIVLYGLPIGPNGALANAIPMGPVSVRGEPVVLAVAVCLAVATYRMSVACGRYLRFDRPALTVLAAQAMVLLAVAVVLLRTTRLF